MRRRCLAPPIAFGSNAGGCLLEERARLRLCERTSESGLVRRQTTSGSHKLQASQTYRMAIMLGQATTSV